jgi:corrinoid protein of di/trimethylamine methyltransferase
MFDFGTASLNYLKRSAAMTKEVLYENLKQSVVDMDEDAAVENAGVVIDEGYDAYDAIENGLSKGMEAVSKLYDDEEYFIPEMLLCSDAMYAGINVLKPHIKTAGQGKKTTIVIGVVEGDTHDIGKNLVKIMLESAGFIIEDLGRDVPPAKFVEKAKEKNAEIIALSALMTTAMNGMKEVIDLLEAEHMRKQVKVIIGGGPVSQAFAAKIGADAYGANAAHAIEIIRTMLGIGR